MFLTYFDKAIKGKACFMMKADAKRSRSKTELAEAKKIEANKEAEFDKMSKLTEAVQQ